MGSLQLIDDDVRKILRSLGDRRQNFLGQYEIYKDSAERRSALLADSLHFQQFRRDAGELRAWMQEKLDVMNDTSNIEPANVEGRSQKAEALKAELEATKRTLDGLNDQGKKMLDKDHFASESVQNILEDLNELYFKLLRKMKDRDEILMDTKNLSDYFTICDEIMVWINEKEGLVKNIMDEIASNPYKVNILDKKHNDFEKELMNHQPEIDDMHIRAEFLIQKKQFDNAQVEARRDEIVTGMQNLRNLSIEAKKKIESAKQIQKFLKDSDEMVDFLKEKKAQTPLENFGEDLEETKSLQRRHQNVERDLVAISSGVNELCFTADNLSNEQPNFQSEILARKTKIEQQWDILKSCANERKKKLQLQFDWFTFLIMHDTCVDWLRDKTREVEEEQLPKSNPEDAMTLLSNLQNVHMRDFASEKNEILKCTDLANQMTEQEHPQSEEVTKMKDKLTALCDSLEEFLNERRTKYQQCVDYLQLRLDIEQCQNAFNKFDEVLNSDDLGDSVETVESLIARLDSQYQSKFVPQKEMMVQLGKISQEMVDGEHYETEHIEEMNANLKELCDRVFERYETMKGRLHFSLKFHIFTRDSDEYLVWIGDRLRLIEKDQSYKSATGELLTASKQSVKAMEAEVKVYEEKIEQVYQIGKELTDKEDAKQDEELQPAYDSVESKLDDLDSQLARLNQALKERAAKLGEAEEGQKYFRMAEELELWMSNTEAKLEVREPGKDLASCEKLMKHHQMIEDDVRQHRDTLERMYSMSKAFYDAEHFDRDNIRNRQDSLQKRYVSLKEPLKLHREWLEDAMRLHQFYRQVDDIQSWMTEREPLIGNVTIGNDYIGAVKLKKKHAQLLHEMDKLRPQLEETLDKADELMLSDHFAKDAIGKEKEKLQDRWKNLEVVAENRSRDLDNSIKAHDYFLEANECENWIKERQNNLDAKVGIKWPNNIDALMSESKRNEKLINEVENYKHSIDTLRNKAEQCDIIPDDPITSDVIDKPEVSDNVSSEAKPLGEIPVRRALVIIPYSSDAPRHLSVGNKEVVTILEEFPDNLLKVQNDDGFTGLVPAAHLKEEKPGDGSRGSVNKLGSRELLIDLDRSVMDKQEDIEEQYNRVLGELRKRDKKLRDRLKMSQLMTQASALRSWIDTKHDKKVVHDELDPDDELQISKALKKAGNFVKKLDANKNSIGSIGEEMIKLGEEDPELQSEVIETVCDVQQLESAAGKMLEQFADATAKLENAHEVKQYLRDCDDLMDRINDKDNSLVVGYYGSDSNGNNILSQKHSGFQSDINNFVDAAKQLENRAQRLAEIHPESKDEINQKLDKIADQLNNLQTKSDDHGAKLNEMSNYFKFDEEFKEATNWIDGMKELIEGDLANDVNSAQAQLERHQDLMHEMDARGPQIRRITGFLGVLKHHPNYLSIKHRVESIDYGLSELQNKFEEREDLLEKNVEYQSMNKEFNLNEQWMKDREHKLDDETDSAGAREDIDKLVNFQETKIIETLTMIEDLFHLGFRVPDLEAKKAQLQSRWVEVRGKLLKRKEEILHERSVVATIEDLDELQNWIDMRIPAAEDTDSLQQSSHIQRRFEKQKAFDAEIDANKDRVQSFEDLVNVKLDSKKTTEEQKQVLQEKIRKITESFHYLVQITITKTAKLKEANRQRLYYTAYEDFKFWLSSVEAQFGDTSYGNDLGTVTNQKKRHTYFEDDVTLHEELLGDLNKLADECILAEQFDPQEIEEKRSDVNSRFEKVKSFTAERKKILEEAYNFYKLLSDIAMEEIWISEKSNVLTKSSDYGQNLPGVENLIKRHRRLKAEMDNHCKVVENLQPVVKEIVEENLIGSKTAQSRYSALLDLWDELCQHEQNRNDLLTQSRLFHELVRDIEELRMWISEKRVLMEQEDFGDNLATVAGLKKKHEALLRDIEDHEGKGKILNLRADKLIQEGNLSENKLKYAIELLWNDFSSVRKLWAVRNDSLQENSAYLQFIWKTDVIDSWINDKKLLIESDEVWRHPIRTMSDVIVLIHKHETFQRSLSTFGNDNIRVIRELHQRVMNASTIDAKELGGEVGGSMTIAPHNRERMTHSFKTIMDRWDSLNSKSSVRERELIEQRDFYQAIEDKYLLFAKKASNFNSWFENSEEDLRDPLRCNSVEEIKALMAGHGEFLDSLNEARVELDELIQLDKEINEQPVITPSSQQPPTSSLQRQQKDRQRGQSPQKQQSKSQIQQQQQRQSNPYTWFTIEALNETWDNLMKRVRIRKSELDHELKAQEKKEDLRKQFAREANTFHSWVVQARERLMQQPNTGTTGTIQEQLDDVKLIAYEVKKQKTKLKNLEELGLKMKEERILDNRHTEHSTLALGQSWEQLEQLCQNMQRNLEQQRNTKESAGVKESTLMDFTKMFRHHDKERVGSLNHDDLKSCLRALGYDLPMLEEGVIDPEFEQILDFVDRERKGYVTLQDYTHFLIMKETDSVSDRDGLVEAFSTLDTDSHHYLTTAQLNQYLEKDIAEYCIMNMKTFVDSNGCLVEDSRDYLEFCERIFSR